MKNRLLVIAFFLVIAMFGSTVVAEAHGSRVYFGVSFGFGAPYYGPQVYGYYPGWYPGWYPVYQLYSYPGYYYRPYYPPPVVYRTYLPYGPRVHRGYAGNHGRYGRGRAHYAPRRYVRR